MMSKIVLCLLVCVAVAQAAVLTKNANPLSVRSNGDRLYQAFLTYVYMCQTTVDHIQASQLTANIHMMESFPEEMKEQVLALVPGATWDQITDLQINMVHWNNNLLDTLQGWAFSETLLAAVDARQIIRDALDQQVGIHSWENMVTTVDALLSRAHLAISNVETGFVAAVSRALDTVPQFARDMILQINGLEWNDLLAMVDQQLSSMHNAIENFLAQINYFISTALDAAQVSGPLTDEQLKQALLPVITSVNRAIDTIQAQAAAWFTQSVMEPAQTWLESGASGMLNAAQIAEWQGIMRHFELNLAGISLSVDAMQHIVRDILSH